MNLTERLDNWGRVWRRRLDLRSTPSLEGQWRSPQPWHEPGPPAAIITPDARDALLIQSAVNAVDAYHGTLLGGWYVWRWSEPKCLHAARKAAGDARTRHRGDFPASLSMAHALVAGALELPESVRTDRIRLRVRKALGLPDVLVVEITLASPKEFGG